MAFHLRFLPLSPESLLPPRSLVHSGGCPQPPISQGCLFPFFLLALRASVLFPYPIPDQVSLTPTPSHPLSPLVNAFFSIANGIETSSLKPFCLLIFLSSMDCILAILYFYIFIFSLFVCLANIYLLVSTYHACPFGSELSHSGWYFLVPSIYLQNSGCPLS